MIRRLAEAGTSGGRKYTTYVCSSYGKAWQQPRRGLCLSSGVLNKTHLLNCRDATENIREIVLNDPSKRNSLSLEMLETLLSEFKRSSQDDQLRAIILKSEPPVFSSGHNLRELRTDASREQHLKIFETCTKLMLLVQELPIPVISGVKGLAAAAGCQLVATCDVVVAGESAKFSTPGINFGLFCSTPGIALARAVPRKVAMDMLLTGEPIGAEAALRAGLVSRVVPDDKVDEECLSIAQKICSLSKPVVGLGKAFFYSQVESDKCTAYRHGEQVMVENLRLLDCQEGLSAFVEKRQPNWTHSQQKSH